MRYPRMLLPAFLLVLAGCAAPGTRTEQGSDAIPAYTLERFRGEHKLAEGVDTLVYDNPYGEIQVRQTGAAELVFQGVEQRIGDKPRIARIEPFHEGQRQGVRVRYAEHDARQPANPRLGRVDLYAFVPKRMKIELHADFGTVTIRRVDNDIRVRTRSGTIVAATRGALDAQSESGEIRAWTMQGGSQTPTRLRTSANIIADIPLFDDLRLEVDSARGVRADFPLLRNEQSASGRWYASWTHGTGAHRMHIESLSGEVTLQALHKPVP